MRGEIAKTELLKATETSIWICSIFGLPIYSSYLDSEKSSYDLSRLLRSWHEDSVGAKEVNTCNKLAGILAKTKDEKFSTHLKLYRKQIKAEKLDHELEISEKLRSLFFKIDEHVTDTTFLLTDCKNAVQSKNQEAISNIALKLVPDFNEFPAERTRMTFIMPLLTSDNHVEGHEHAWDIFEYSKEDLKTLSQDKNWILRLIIAFQLAGLSWISPDKNKLLYRVLSALGQTEAFDNLKSENEAGDRAVFLKDELEKQAKKLLRNNQINLKDVKQIELQCSLPITPERQKLKEIYPLQNQKTKQNRLRDDLKALRTALSHTLTEHSGVIISFELPLVHYKPEKNIEIEKPKASYFPIICAPDLIHDYLCADRSLDDRKLKDKYRKERRKTIRASRSNDHIESQTTTVYFDPDSPDFEEGKDWKDLLYQRAVKLRKYLYKTYAKTIPSLLDPSLPFQVTIMFRIFRDITPDVQIYMGEFRKGSTYIKHYWLNVKGYNVDISLTKKKGEIIKGITLVEKESKIHKNFLNTIVYKEPPEEGYKLNASKSISIIAEKTLVNIIKEISKENEILLKKGKL